MDYSRSKINRDRHLQKRKAGDPNLNAFGALNLDDPDSEPEPQNDANLEDQLANEKDDDNEIAASSTFDDADEAEQRKGLKVNEGSVQDIGNMDDADERPSRSQSATRQIIVDIAAGDEKTNEEVLHINHLGWVMFKNEVEDSL